VLPLSSVPPAWGTIAPPADNNPWFGTQYFRSAGNRREFMHGVVEQIELTVISVVVGFVVSFALVLLIRRWRLTEGPVLLLTDGIYSIPSIALFALLQPFVGYSLLGPIIGLSAYTLLTLVRNILEGLRGVPADTVEAATGLGYGAARRLVTVELPLALPAVFAGLRVATVSAVSLVTVAFALSHGGLGQVLTIAYKDNLYRQPVLYAVLGCVVIALVFDLLLVAAQRATTPWARARARA